MSDRILGVVGLALAAFFIWQATQIELSFISDPVGPRTSRATALVKRSNTVPENADLNQREEIQYTLVKNTMANFDQAMESQIRKELAGFVR